MKRIAALAFLSLLNPAFAADRLTDRAFTTRSEVYAPKAMAATSHPLATQIALEVMRDGGNAVDAAIAANAALGLMEPTGNGVGGDLFAIIWDAESKKLYGYNGSGRSPKRLTLAEFERRGLKEIPSHGPLPVTVPGAVDGWMAMHERFGKVSRAKVFAGAIQYAEQGFPLSDVIAHYWNLSVPKLGKFPGFNEQFTRDGVAPKTGELWRNPNLAETYKRIVKDGHDGFYRGKTAKVIATYMKEQGGYLDEEDLASHRGEWVEPVSTNYRGYDVHELPPNGQGLAALQMLELLETYDFSKIPFGSAEHLHLFLEAKKLAFADRAKFYADPAFATTPIAGLLSAEYTDTRRKLINPDRAALAVGPGEPANLNEGDTIYLTTADAQGNMVSLIQSNYRGMGSGMAPHGLGFILQDRGEQFVLKAGHANTYAPGKRPFHTIIPAFITKNGAPLVSFGLMGGAMQPQGHVQIVMNLVDFGMNLQEAGDAPRIHHDGSTEPAGQNDPMQDGGIVNLEHGFAPEVIRTLMRKGHRIQFADGPYGGYQAIKRLPSGVWVGASESRKDGQAAGY